MPITHVDHHWVIWDAYQEQTINLRQYAANLDQEVIDDIQQQNLTDQLIAQWEEANQAADEAELTLDQFIAELELLEAQRQLLPEQEAQLETFSELLPTLKEQLAIAQEAADVAKATTTGEQAEYDISSQAYQTALNDVLEKKATLDTNTQNLLQQIANTRAWVEQQTISLDTELSETVALQLQLQTEAGAISAVQAAYNGDWSGAIFNAAMAVVGYKLSTVSAEISQATDAVKIAKAETTLKTLKTYQAVAGR